MTELISSDSDLINAEPAKVSCCTVQRIKVLKHAQTISKVFRHQIHKSRTHLKCIQMSAICAVVAPLIYLSNSCSVYVMTTSRAVLLGATESATGIRKKKKQQHQQFWEKLCSNTWLVVEASLFNSSTSTLLRV